MILQTGQTTRRIPSASTSIPSGELETVSGLSQYLFTLLVVLLVHTSLTWSVAYQVESKPMTMSIERTPRQRKGISNDSSQLLSELVGAVKGDGKEDLSTQVLQKQLDRAEIRMEKLEVKIERLESENAGLKDSVQDLRIMLAVANERQRVATGSG